MRVLMAARTFLPEGRGGMESHSYHLARYLLSRGHEVGMLHCAFRSDRPEYELSEAQLDGIRLFRLVRNYTYPVPNPYPFYDLQVEAVFDRIVATYKPHLVHFHHLADLSASLPAAARRHGVPVVQTLHDFWPMCFLSHLRTPDGVLCPGPDEGLRCMECLWKQDQQKTSGVSIRARVRELGFRESARRAPRFLADSLAARLSRGRTTFDSASLRIQMVSLATRNMYMREAVSTADLVISPSRFLLDRFVAWGIRPALFRHVANSVPASLGKLRSAARPQRERTVFGFVGSLYPPKGVHVLVDAFKRLDPARAELRIWGKVPVLVPEAYAARLQELAKGLPNLSFLGGFSPEELEAVLAQIDVLVLPSVWYENNPLVILEAFAAGIPVIAGNIGGMAELVDHDVNGLQFQVGDAHDLAEKMRMMLDAERRDRYRAAIVAPWTHEELGAEIERTYLALIRPEGLTI